MLGIIIQARMGSTRLPSKVIKKIQDKTVLEHVLDRAQQIKKCDKVILALPGAAADDILADIAAQNQVPVFRGSENDVLDRFYQAAKEHRLDIVVRITADCPVHDLAVDQKVIDLFLSQDYDYVSNVRPPSYPDGFDIEVFRFSALQKAWQKARLRSDREHVTPYIAKNAPPSRVANQRCADGDYSWLRLTLDRQADFDFINEIYKNLYPANHYFGLKDILALFKKKPELLPLNPNIRRNEGYLKSLKEDEKNNSAPAHN